MKGLRKTEGKKERERERERERDLAAAVGGDVDGRDVVVVGRVQEPAIM